MFHHLTMLCPAVAPELAAQTISLKDPQGARARLHNLGYLPDVAGPAPALAAACRAFQHDQKLPTTGLLDAATLPALERAHDGGLP